MKLCFIRGCCPKFSIFGKPSICTTSLKPLISIFLGPPLHSAFVEKILGSCGRVIATDLSPVALSVAAFNVQKCGLQLSESIIVM